VLTRADAGALNLKFQEVNLVELARMRCSSLSVLGATRRLVLAVEAAEPWLVRGDTDRLSQVLDNLLDNAIRHAPDGSTITVAFQKEGSDVKCSVIDHGPGIPARHLPFIFERFYRAESSRNRHTGGSGLGLAIVHSLVQAQGGRVSAHSIEGQGTTLSFWLPEVENCPQTA